jgi:hypothetical protein
VDTTTTSSSSHFYGGKGDGDNNRHSSRRNSDSEFMMTSPSKSSPIYMNPFSPSFLLSKSCHNSSYFAPDNTLLELEENSTEKNESINEPIVVQQTDAFLKDVFSLGEKIDYLKHLSEASLSLAQTFIYHEGKQNNSCSSSMNYSSMCFHPERIRMIDFLSKIQKSHEECNPSIPFSWILESKYLNGDQFSYPDLLTVVMNSVLFHVTNNGCTKIAIKISFRSNSCTCHLDGSKCDKLIDHEDLGEEIERESLESHRKFHEKANLETKEKSSTEGNLLVSIKVSQSTKKDSSSIRYHDNDTKEEYEMLDANTLNRILKCVKASYRVKIKTLSTSSYPMLANLFHSQVEWPSSCKIEHLITLPCVVLT